MRQTRIQKEALQSHLDWPYDLFITCASFEDRSLVVGNSVDPAGFGSAIIASSDDLTSSNLGQNKGYLLDRFSNRGKDIQLDINRPLKTADTLFNALEGYANTSSILVDITTFTHEWLLILLFVLKEQGIKSENVTLAYASASEYSIGESLDDKWLSKGVLDVRTVLGYSGELDPLLPTHLVVLVGFENHRATHLIDAIDPVALTLGHGASGSETDPKHSEANQRFYDLVLESEIFRSNVKSFSFSCSDPDAARRALDEACSKYVDYNHIIAPMNTKLSTVASAFFGFDHERVQLCYAQPVSYNKKGYSRPSGAIYVIRLGSGCWSYNHETV